MHQKVKIWLLFILITPIIVGLFGILFDFILFFVSSEYFTNFKFILFQISEGYRSNKVLAISLVGFLGNWWIGIPIGIILGGYGIWKKDYGFNVKVKFKSIGIVLLAMLITGGVGYLFGKIFFSSFYLSDVFLKSESYNVEMIGALSEIVDTQSFFTTGITNLSAYLGMLIGLFAGNFYQLKKWKA